MTLEKKLWFSSSVCLGCSFIPDVSSPACLPGADHEKKGEEEPNRDRVLEVEAAPWLFYLLWSRESMK